MLAAIEIGGTKLQLGLHSGETTDDGWSPWTDFQRRQVDASLGAAGILEQIEQVVSTWQSNGVVIDAIGIGFGGPVADGRVIISHQIDGWEDFPLSSWARYTFGIKNVRIANDCDSAALAEATDHRGAAAQLAQRTGEPPATVFYVTVGTGVGGGLVIDGKLHGQTQPSAAEIGHLRPGPGATTVGETVESLSSGWGIANTARRLLRDGDDKTDDGRKIIDRAGGLDQVDTQLLSELAVEGNAVAMSAIQRGVTTLGWGIAQVITLVCPHLVVVGGGVSLMPESLFLTPLREAVAQYVFPPLANSYVLEPAALGEEVVVQGALKLAKEASSDRSD